MERGLNSKGYKVCKYAFKVSSLKPPSLAIIDNSQRVEGQAPIPQQTDESDEEGSGSDEDSAETQA